MEKQDFRPGHKNRKFQCNSLELTPSDREVMCNDKNKYKKHGSHQKRNYETNSFPLNWPAQARLHPFSQRSYSTPDSSVCHYSVPLSFSFEPVSLPVYSAFIQPQGNCAASLNVVNHSKKSRHNKTHRRSVRGHTDSAIEVPAIFHTPRLNRDQQDFTSLPPVNCDMYLPKSSESEVMCKRRFSDPGLGQMSSDDCSTTKSGESSNSSATDEFESHDYFSLIEQVNELKESNSHLRKELQETKLELESLKCNSQLRLDCDSLKPGTLSDAICEIRNAVKMSEEALIAKAVSMVEKSAAEHKENQSKLEERLKEEINGRLKILEDEVRKLSGKDEVTVTVVPEICNASSFPGLDQTVHQQVAELEKEKVQLQKELQEAVAKKKSAEATTEKLERLVGILRKKINGVSLESSIIDEKQNSVRPLASSLEKNPFIIANNRQGQKPKVPFRTFPPQEGGIEIVGENKETETVESTGNENENESCGLAHSSAEGSTSLTAQVTMTGPVTDL